LTNRQDAENAERLTERKDRRQETGNGIGMIFRIRE
jgi:hypothetical protein